MGGMGAPMIPGQLPMITAGTPAPTEQSTVVKDDKVKKRRIKDKEKEIEWEMAREPARIEDKADSDKASAKNRVKKKKARPVKEAKPERVKKTKVSIDADDL